MSKTLNLAGMLDFSEVDLTAPDKVIEEILEQLPEDTQNINTEKPPQKAAFPRKVSCRTTVDF